MGKLQPYIERTCNSCSVPFVAKRTTHIYCSKRCNLSGYTYKMRNVKPRECIACKKSFSPRRFQGQGFCSPQCSSLWRIKVRLCEVPRQYGISVADFWNLHKRQSGVCAICSKPDKRRLSIDHCHKSWAVRGLLCRRCNMAVSYFDDRQMFSSILRYLGMDSIATHQFQRG